MRQARTADPDAHGMAEAVLLSGRIWAARPLLGLRRETIRAYLRDQGVSGRTIPATPILSSRGCGCGAPSPIGASLTLPC